MSDKKAIIFDIKEFALHDGPGVRTTVFFKGCPLRCLWCHNPEGLSPKPELMTKHLKCRHCGRCAVKCGHEICKPFGRCIYACPDALITVCGKEWGVPELTERLLRDADYLRSSGGGVTFSGGEPLMQHDFLTHMLISMREHGVHTCIETSGSSSPEIFKRVAELTDYVIMDLKLADPELHRQYTGVDNKNILINAEYLKARGHDCEFRVPLIPNITDTEENLSAIRKIAGDIPLVTLPYNNLAGAKYPMLGKKYALE